MKRVSISHKLDTNRAQNLLQKKTNTIKDPLQEMVENNLISSQEIVDIKRAFRRYDQYQINGIEWYEVDDVYRDIGVDIQDSSRKFIKKKLDSMNIKTASIQDVVTIYIALKDFLLEELDDLQHTDTLNAFTAMGGEMDKTGHVRIKTIIEIIRDDFQLDFDIEGYIEKVGLGDLEVLVYEDFQKLFDSEDAKEILSNYSRDVQSGKRKRIVNKNSNNDEFSVDYRDFEQWENLQKQKLQLENLGQAEQERQMESSEIQQQINL